LQRMPLGSVARNGLRSPRRPWQAKHSPAAKRQTPEARTRVRSPCPYTARRSPDEPPLPAPAPNLPQQAQLQPPCTAPLSQVGLVLLAPAPSLPQRAQLQSPCTAPPSRAGLSPLAAQAQVQPRARAVTAISKMPALRKTQARPFIRFTEPRQSPSRRAERATRAAARTV
jgi:hypothetical protein